MCPANESWCYNVASFLIGWAHTQNDPWSWSVSSDPIEMAWAYNLFQWLTTHFIGITFLELFRKLVSREVIGLNKVWYGVPDIGLPIHAILLKKNSGCQELANWNIMNETIWFHQIWVTNEYNWLSWPCIVLSQILSCVVFLSVFIDHDVDIVF